MSAPASIASRPFADADIDALAALFALDEEHTLGRPSKITPADLRAWVGEVDLDRDTWLAEEAGRPVAVGWVWRRGELANGVGVVHPDARDRGFGSWLVESAERRAADAGAKRLQYDVLARDVGGPALLEARGFREVRRFYIMAIELQGPPPSPIVPDRVTLETFREDDAREFFAALDEAFQDHWEHHSRPFDEWWESKRTQPGYDPTLWFVVRDGRDIVAAARNYPNRNGGGWVDALGVRRAYRGRGLAKALLYRTFEEFHARGVNRISLGVDAQNPTGATELYEKVGMERELELITFEKQLG
jgi:ribosomal protein S18 acetylase RimI-like enzyme